MMYSGEIVQRKKDFDIKKGILLPIYVTEHKVGKHYLFIAPEKASFITTNEWGRRILGFFKSGYTIEQVINIFKGEGIDLETIVFQLQQFLVKVEKKGFYEDATITDFHVEHPSLHLDLTSRCNLTCPQCFQNAGKEKPDELTTQEWLKIIDIFSSKHKTNVCLSGGEPMMHPGIYYILERAKERGLSATLFTNGTFITSEDVVQRLAKLVDKIQISLDGATAEVNDQIRGEGVFNHIIQVVQWLNHSSITIDIAISVMPQNVHDLKQNLKNLAESLGPKVNIRLSPVMKEGRAIEEHLFYSKNIATQSVREITGTLYQKHLKILPQYEKNIKINNCGFGESIVISSTGNIYPCNVNEDRVRYGNIKECDLLEIMKKIDADRKRVDVESIETCKNCDLKIVCFGGCRMNNLYRNNNLFVPLCTPLHKEEICKTVVDQEENFDPLALWMAEETLVPDNSSL